MDSSNKALDEFLAQADAYDGSPDQFWKLKAGFLSLSLSGYFTGWVNQHLAELLRTPDEAGLWFWPQFKVRQVKGLTLSLRVIAAQAPLQSSAEAAMYSPLGAQPLRCDIYRMPPHQNEVFDPEVRLEAAGSATTNQGEIFLAPPEGVYDFLAPASKSAVAATLSTPFFTRLKWTFDRDSLKAVRASDADIIDMQLRAASDVLGILGDASSLEVLEGLATHPHHAVRWNAIQNIGRIKAGAARPLLEHALSDPHPHIRAAAAKTLRAHRPV